MRRACICMQLPRKSLSKRLCLQLPPPADAGAAPHLTNRAHPASSPSPGQVRTVGSLVRANALRSANTTSVNVSFGSKANEERVATVA